MDDGGPHVVVAMRRGVGVLMNSAVAAMRVRIMIVRVPVLASTQQKDTRDIDRQPQARDRNSLVKADWNRPYEAQYRFVTDEERNHGQHNGAGKSCEVAQLAGAE